MDFRIEKASPSYFDKFFKVFKKSLKNQFPEYTKNTIRYFIEEDYRETWLKSATKNGNKILLVAKDRTESIVGFLLANKQYGGIGFCSWIAVEDSFHRRGIGEALLNKWEELSKEQGAHTLQLWTTEKNLEFYKKCGYKLVGRVPHGFFGSEDNLFYKEIQKPKESNFLRTFLAKTRS